MYSIRYVLGNGVYTIGLLIVLVLLGRFLIELFALTGYFGWYLDLTQLFMNPFLSSFNNYQLGTFSISISTLLAITVVLIFASVVEQFLLTPFQENLKNFLIELCISVFKFFEFLLLYKLFLDFFGASENSHFVMLINDLSGYFFGSLVEQVVSFNSSIFNYGALFVLIIVVFLDLFIEQFLELILGPIVRKSDRGVRYRVTEVTKTYFART